MSVLRIPALLIALFAGFCLHESAGLDEIEEYVVGARHVLVVEQEDDVRLNVRQC